MLISSCVPASCIAGSLDVISSDMTQNTSNACVQMHYGTLKMLGKFKTGSHDDKLDNEDSSADPVYCALSVLV